MSFDGWPEGQVAVSTHRLPVIARRALPTVKTSPEQQKVWSVDGYSLQELRYTPDGRSLIVVLEKRLKEGDLYHFRVWDAVSGKERWKLFQIDPEPLKSVWSPYLAVSANGKLLALRYNTRRATKVGKDYRSTDGCEIHVFDLESGRTLWNQELVGVNILGAAFSPDGRALIAGLSHVKETGEGLDRRYEFSGEFRCYDGATGRTLEMQVPGKPHQIPWSVTSVGEQLLVHGADRDRATNIDTNYFEVLDLESKKVRVQLTGATQGTLSPDGTRLLTSAARDSVKVWNAQTGGELAALPLDLELPHFFTRLFWSPDGKYAFVAGSQGQLWRWDPTSKEPPLKVDSYVSKHEEKEQRRRAWSPDVNLKAGVCVFGLNGELPRRVAGRRLTEDYDELPPPELVVWDLKTMQRRATFTGHHGTVNCFMISPDGKSLVSGGSDGTVRLWKMPEH